MLENSFFAEALRDNAAAIPLQLESLILAAAGNKAVVCSNGLDLRQYARLGHCELHAAATPRPDSYRYWGGEEHDRLYTNYEQVVWEVRWHEACLQVVHVEWATGCGSQSRDWVIAESVEQADEFILEVERKTHAPGDAILVFSDGHWQRSHALYEATQKASFEDLVLNKDIKSSLRNDFRQFLESEERYQRLNMAWRRGALMIGPPGNGKTHCVRALVKELGISSLYVQSLSHHYYTPQQLWQTVFDRARGLTPCVLVLEDLDSLVDDENRSFFLNQLDGFEQNHGLIVLATTNYPERIDAAIIDRPSRFDRKYHFELPSLSERETYFRYWQQELAGEIAWSSGDIHDLSITTEGFSFAYLKELVISSVMKWMQQPARPFEKLLVEQAKLLAGQRQTDSPNASNGRARRGWLRRV